jgi:cytoskeletal protein CcmA (bactofilin family)
MGLFSRDDTPSTSSSEITVISEGMKIFGEIAAQDNVYINGTFTGKIVAKGEIAVGPKGRVEGNIHAATVRVAGIVDGNMECAQLSVLPTGKVYGQLRTSTLEIHPGGFIDAEHRLRAAVQADPMQPSTSDASDSNQAAVVTPLHGGRDTPWALRKMQVPTYRSARNSPDDETRHEATAKTPNTDHDASDVAGATPEKKRWHGSRREAS